jgi:hypothetical protein
MNNRQPNRRRGRGNTNRTPNNNRNGYDNQNRIDNRARGNAAQMLEKFKKQAQDAQLNGDRVQAEYYHQFADHYFRVLADFRSRQEESRPQREWRNDEREGGEERDWRDEERDTHDSGEEAETAAEPEAAEDDYRRPPRQDREPREDRGARNERNPRSRSNNNNNNNNSRRDRNEPRADRNDAPVGLDHSILPPAIGVAANDAEEAPVAEKAPARKPRARRPKAADDAEVAAAE